MDYPQAFDVIVIGGGHAGTEAALAAARMGCQTLLISHSIETLGQMSCNPAIGGIGKSQLVREIDALGGAMALATDAAGIQFRVLNSRKGPAVRATRAQADRILYKAAIKKHLYQQVNLTVFQQAVDDLVLDGERVCGVITQMGLTFRSKTVVLTAGTFLAGKLHIGLENSTGGRAGDPAAETLAHRLRDMAFKVDRLKTGTPPRIDARTVDFTVMQEQWGDTPEPVMSLMSRVEDHPEQRCCWITHTNTITHDIIASNLDRSPLFSGVIEGTGPRYCPSIEDKIHRFAGKESHQIFVEPEGLTSNELYPNGISTSLPFDVQYRLVRSIKGFEQAHIVRPGYAIEYDFFDPRGLHHTLETKTVRGLFFAGQINGTTGYEEAAAQGLIAGLNAALLVQEQPAWTPSRKEAYIGVMIDDLVTQGTIEPYRMFTSRAEHRLFLREDNADQRLTPKGYELGLVAASRWSDFQSKMSSLEQEKTRLKTSFVQAGSTEAKMLEAEVGVTLTREYSLADLLKRPEVTYRTMALLTESNSCREDVAQQLEIESKYEGYIARQEQDVQRMSTQTAVQIPPDFDYSLVSGLSSELSQKLKVVQPVTIDQASRIAGMTPAALSLLVIYLKKHRAAVAELKRA